MSKGHNDGLYRTTWGDKSHPRASTVAKFKTLILIVWKISVCQEQSVK